LGSIEEREMLAILSRDGAGLPVELPGTGARQRIGNSSVAKLASTSLGVLSNFEASPEPLTK
jgi:hypothetical protein